MKTTRLAALCAGRALIVLAAIGAGCQKSEGDNASNKSEPENTVELRARSEKGEAHAQTVLGVLYLSSAQVQKDIREGRKWLLRAAQQGDVDAQVQLGASYSNHDPRDEKESARWLRKAADQDDGPAQLALGLKYITGTGVEKNSVEGVKWLALADANKVPGASKWLQKCSGLLSSNELIQAFQLAKAVRPSNRGQKQKLKLTTALVTLASEASAADIENVIQWGADVNGVGDPSGDTPLRVAASRGNLEGVKALLKAGADVSRKVTLGNQAVTPLQSAKAAFELLTQVKALGPEAENHLSNFVGGPSLLKVKPETLQKIIRLLEEQQLGATQ